MNKLLLKSIVLQLPFMHDSTMPKIRVFSIVMYKPIDCNTYSRLSGMHKDIKWNTCTNMHRLTHKSAQTHAYSYINMNAQTHHAHIIKKFFFRFTWLAGLHPIPGGGGGGVWIKQGWRLGIRGYTATFNHF